MREPREENLFDLARKIVQEAEANALANPKTDEILIVVVEPHKMPYKKIIPNTLEAMKEIVEGWIENVFIGKTEKGARVGIVINEEGKLIGLPFNRQVIGRNLMGRDNLVGNMFITAYNLEGDSISLTEQEADKYIRQFSALEVYL